MTLDFDFEFANTIFLLRDCQGNVIKKSKQIPESFFYMEFMGNSTYWDKTTGAIWSKKTTSLVNDGCLYFQEEYIDITDLWLQKQKLLQELERDMLTQISNIRAVENKKNEILAADKSCTLVMCDINSFKTINDGYGHVMGDRCLTEIAQLFSSFISSQDLVARVGGDEFFFIFQTDDVASVTEIMNKIQEEVIKLGETLNIPLSVSVGISLYQKGDNWDQKREEADFVSYRNKELMKKKNLVLK